VVDLPTRALTLLGTVLVVALSGCAPTSQPATDAAEPAAITEAAPAPKPTGLDIPAIGVHVTGLAELALTPAGTMEVPDDATTTGWYAPGPAPGDPGPAILAAHVNYNGVAGTFSRLHELKIGDQAIVTGADGSTATFEVYRVDRFPKSAFPTDLVYGNSPDAELRLVTCGGELDTAARSYRDNVVAFARRR
jgi:sortase (surface protein transpeptidase)